MISSEAQRTLVKSPPELWNELSEPASLSRHLGELGDIRITNMEPESVVEWEAELLRGTVKLEPSGWGTRVTLTVNREFPDSDGSAMPEMESPLQAVVPEDFAQPEKAAQPEQAAQAEQAQSQGEPEPSNIEPQAAGAPPEQEAKQEAKTGLPSEEPLPRQGFFARIFRSFKGRPAPAQDPVPTQNLVPTQELAPTPDLAPAHDQAPSPDLDLAKDVAPEQDIALSQDAADEQGSDLTSELAAAEEAVVAQDTALLTSVLDSLGAAHHRPFSRA